MGELVDRFANEIPLHHAARKWAMGRPDRELPPAYRMRFYTLTQELHWLQCKFEPAGVNKTYDTRVVVHGMCCPRCGELYVAEKRRAVHGVLCGGPRG